MSETARPASSPALSFTPRRLLLVGTGAISVAFLPYWIKWLDIFLPSVECRVVVTRSAEKFVTREALSAVNDTVAMPDAWPAEPRTTALHVEWAQWADAIAVYPATVNFLGRYAAGLADSPALLAMHCSQAPIGLAPSLPPGAITNPLLTRRLEQLEQSPNVCVLPPEPGRSGTTGANDAYVPPELPKLLELMERTRAAMTEPLAGGHA